MRTFSSGYPWRLPLLAPGRGSFFHPDVEIISTVQGNGLRFITDVGYDNSGIRRDIHTKFSFGIGDNTIGGPFSRMLAPIIGSPLESVTFPLTVAISCRVSVLSSALLLFWLNDVLPSITYLMSVPLNIWSSTSETVWLLALMSTVRRTSTFCLLYTISILFAIQFARELALPSAGHFEC